MFRDGFYRLKLTNVILFTFTTIGFGCMKHKLSDDLEKKFQDIPAFNSTIIQSGFNLSNTIINEKKITGIVVKNSKWESIDLQFVDGTNSLFEECVFTDLKVHSTDFSKSVFSRCTFKNSDFDSSNFTESKFLDCQFENVSFASIDLWDIIWERSNFQSVKVKESIGYNAKLENLFFNNCEFVEFGFSRSKIVNLKIKETKVISFSLNDCQIEKADINLEGRSVFFSRSTIHEFTLRGPGAINVLSMEKVTGYNIHFENFSKIFDYGFDDAIIDTLTIRNVNANWIVFYDAKISNATFENMLMISGRYDGATLSNSIYKNVIFGEDQSFDSLTLDSVKFENITKSPDYKPSFKNTIFKNTEKF
jgi:uncharacterized protein YjbI with pentapeptide repeats